MPDPIDLAADLAERITRHLGAGWQFRVHHADEPDLDDEIAFVTPSGAVSTVELQAGPYGIVPTTSHFENGELDGVTHHMTLEVDPRDLDAAARRIAPLIAQADTRPAE